jgi:CelD/BcsL family acetyltransferase involved in cellulose biosynthesis/GNAT superfamily N-acetyltransferase
MANTHAPNIEILRGADADRLLDDPAFVDRWRRLCAACPWATAFQGPDFVLTWYRTYRPRFEPVLVLSRAAGGELLALLTLAASADGGLAVGGAWHAEYHAWVCSADLADTFPPAALAAARRLLPSAGLRFTYLPPNTPLAWLASDPVRARCLLTPHRRPLMRLGDGSAIAESLSKSGNKSRLKRLKKLGPVEFKRVTDPAELAHLFDDLIACYDARRMAISGSAPFRNDPLKRPFHLAMAAAPGLLHATVLTVGPHLAAAHLGLRTGGELQLGLIAHNPLFAAHSPGKFQLLFLAQLLLREGCDRLDLTAGGDPYKERFADDSDQVHTLVAFPTRVATARGRAEALASRSARAALNRLKIPTTRVHVLRSRLKRVRAKSVVTAAASAVCRAAAWVRSERVVHVLAQPLASLAQAAPVDPAFAVHRDRIADLLAYAPDEPGPTPQDFTSDALTRLEAGQHLYTRVEGERLVTRGWLVERPDPDLLQRVLPGFTFPANAALILDLHTSPSVRNRGLATDCLRAIARDASRIPDTDQILIAVPARNRAALRAAERAGFQREATLVRATRVGRIRTSLAPARIAPPPAVVAPTPIESGCDVAPPDRKARTERPRGKASPGNAKPVPAQPT